LQDKKEQDALSAEPAEKRLEEQKERRLNLEQERIKRIEDHKRGSRRRRTKRNC